MLLRMHVQSDFHDLPLPLLKAAEQIPLWSAERGLQTTEMGLGRAFDRPHKHHHVVQRQVLHAQFEQWQRGRVKWNRSRDEQHFTRVIELETSRTVCELASIVLNKNTVPGDKSAMTPSGLRVGAPAMTSRGLVEEDFKKIGDFIARAVDVTAQVQKESGPKMKDFKAALATPPGSLLELKAEVEDFASRFETVGF